MAWADDQEGSTRGSLEEIDGRAGPPDADPGYDTAAAKPDNQISFIFCKMNWDIW